MCSSSVQRPLDLAHKYPAARDKLVIDFNCGPSTGHEKETELEMIVKCIYRFVLGRGGARVCPHPPPSEISSSRPSSHAMNGNAHLNGNKIMHACSLMDAFLNLCNVIFPHSFPNNAMLASPTTI